MRVRVGFPVVNSTSRQGAAVWVETDERGERGTVSFNGQRLNATVPTKGNVLLDTFLRRLAKTGSVSLHSKDDWFFSPKDRQLDISGESFGMALELADHFRLRNAQEADVNVLLSGFVDPTTGGIVRPLGDPNSLALKGQVARAAAASLVVVVQDCVSALVAILPDAGRFPARDATERLFGNHVLYHIVVDSSGRYCEDGQIPWWDRLGLGLGLRRLDSAQPRTPAWYSPLNALVRTQRQYDLESLIALGATGSGNRLVTVHGPGGMGKTRLAIAAATAATANLPGGQFYACLTAPTESRNALIALIATAVQHSDRSDSDATFSDLLRALPADSCLLLLDNFELADRIEAARLICDLLLERPQLMILVASQQQLGLPGIEQLFPLDVGMTADEAAELFEVRARLLRPDWRPSFEDRELIDQITMVVERIPLAIELAAAWFDSCPLAKIAEGLHAHGNLRFTEMPPGDVAAVARHQSMTTCVEWAVSLLNPTECRAFLATGVFDTPVIADPLAAVLDIGRDDAAAVLRALSRRALLREIGRNAAELQYDAHRFIRSHARQKLADCADADVLECRFVAYYHRSVERHSPGLRKELGNLVRAVALGERHHDLGTILVIAKRLTPWLRTAQRWLEWRDVELAALRVLEADRHSRPTPIYQTLLQLAKVFRLLGDLGGAERYYLRALELAQQRLGPRNVVEIREELASLLSVLGRYDEAQEQVELALDTKIVALRAMDEVPRAHELFARLYINRNKWAAAELHAKNSLALNASQKRDAPGARLLLADIYQNTQRFNDAEAEYRSLIKEGHSLAKARAGLAGVLSDQGKHAEAHAIIDSMIAQAQSKQPIAVDALLRALQKRARVFANEGRIDESVATYDNAIEMARKAPDPLRAAYLTDKKGRVLQQAGRYDAALVTLESARSMFLRLGLPSDVRKVEESLACLRSPDT